MTHNAFRYKKPGFLPRTLLPPRMSHTTFYVRWHRILKSGMLIRGGRGGGSQPKTSGFCNSGWPGMRQGLPIDCLPILNNKPHPKNKKTITRDAQIQTATNPMQDRNFGMFRGQGSTMSGGFSGEPRLEFESCAEKDSLCGTVTMA